MYVNIVYWRQLINGKICKNIVNQGQIKVELPKIRNPTKKRDEDDVCYERNNPREGHPLQSVMKIFYKVVINPKHSCA